jgi:putative endonuclease
MHQYYVYMLTNFSRSTLYTGITNDLEKRLYQHRTKAFSGFSARYHVDRLVHFECFQYVNDALAREKQIKGWVRARKDALVNEHNPDWKDLSSLVLNDDLHLEPEDSSFYSE